MGLMDLFKKKDKKKEASNGDSLLKQAYEYSGKTFMSFEEFKNSDYKEMYEFCYTALIALLAGHPQELYVANKDTDMFVDGKIDMEGALREVVGWYRTLTRNGDSLELAEFEKFMLLENRLKFNYSANLASKGLEQVRASRKAYENALNSGYNKVMQSMSGVESEYDSIRRRM